ncbi:hypothetical protein Tco_0645671 [Tanacetum coccineum]
MDYLCTTEAELGIDLDRPLSEQDPLDRLNDLANKKTKHANDIHNFFRANKRLKLSVQYKDHPAALHDFASCLPTELKELPSKIIGLSREIKELKKHIRDMKIELPRDLKETISVV